MVKVINKEEFKKEIFDYSGKKEFSYEKETPVILNFFATWCGPCRAFGPTLEKIQEEYGSKIKVVKIDVDELNEVADLFNIRGVPSTYFINPRSSPFLVSGNVPKETVEKVILELFKVSKN